MSAARLALISNSKSTRSKNFLHRVKAALEDYSGEMKHREIDDIGDIAGILVDFAEYDPDILVVNGGDGTVQAVLTASSRMKPFEQLPPILVLPSGQTNLIAEDLGSFGPPDSVLRKALPLLESGVWRQNLTERRLIRLKVRPDDPPIYGAFFGTAAIVRGLEFVRRKIHPLGGPNWLMHTAGIALVFAAALFNRNGLHSPARSDEATIDIEDGPKTRYRYFVIMATTLNRLLLGLRPFPKGDGTSSLRVIAVDYTLGAIMRGLAATVFRGIDRKVPKGMIAMSARSVRILIDCPITLDGEFYIPDTGVPVELSVTQPIAFLRIKE